MNVLLIAHCKGKALQRTRQVLDRYATRVSATSWKTPITQEGLASIHSNLRKTASKNTCVACFKNEGHRDLKLLFFVGTQAGAGAFLATGQAACGSTARRMAASPLHPVERSCALLAQGSGMTHDLGKLARFFQKKIAAGRQGLSAMDPIRHEWLSACIVQAMCAQVREAPEGAITSEWIEQLWADFDLRALAKKGSIKSQHPLLWPQWLKSNNQKNVISDLLVALQVSVLTHHGLLRQSTAGSTLEQEDVQGSRHLRPHLLTEKNLKDEVGLDASGLSRIAPRIGRILSRIDQLGQKEMQNANLVQATLLHRAFLILADHCVSARDTGWEKKYPSPGNAKDWKKQVWANPKAVFTSNRKKPLMIGRQPLEWHLSEVGQLASELHYQSKKEPGQLLQDFELERLGSISHAEAFRWQNSLIQSSDTIKKKMQMLTAFDKDGFSGAGVNQASLFFNVADTGSGKTRSNIKLLIAAQKAQGYRAQMTIALGLRSLTLQSATMISKDCGLLPDSVACLLGDHTYRQLQQSDILHRDLQHDHDAIDGDLVVSMNAENSVAPAWIETIECSKPGARVLLNTPIVVCTADSLIKAAYPNAQGLHAVQLLRIAQSDLIIDEIDQFGPSEIHALLNLIFLVGLFNRNLVISTASLTAELAEKVHQAYQQGQRSNPYQAQDNPVDAQAWMISNRSFKKRRAGALFSLSDQKKESDDPFATLFNTFREGLNKTVSNKRARLIDFDPSATVSEVFDLIVNQALDLHCENSLKAPEVINALGEPVNYSFGFIRLARVNQVNALIEHLEHALPFCREKGFEVKLGCLHSRDLMLTRSAKEARLNTLLKRKDERHIVNDPDVLKAAKASKRKHLVFILVASPAIEIGNDHHWDWGVIEPSSTAAIMQCAGRILRHTPSKKLQEDQCNIALLRYNLTALTRNNTDQPVFQYPGFEQHGYLYPEHDAKELLFKEKTQLLISPNLLHDPDCLFARLDKQAQQRFLEGASVNPDKLWNTQDWLFADSKKYPRWRVGFPQHRFFFSEEKNWSAGHLVTGDSETHENGLIEKEVDLIIENSDDYWLGLTEQEANDIISTAQETDLKTKDLVSCWLPESYSHPAQRLRFSFKKGFLS